MSSVQSSFAQVGPRGKYLLATATATAVTVDAGLVVESVMTAADFATATTVDATVTVGKLYTDMGKTVNVVGTNGLVVQKYVKARVVNGADSEGNDGSGDCVYILSWSADSAVTVKFARTG